MIFIREMNAIIMLYLLDTCIFLCISSYIVLSYCWQDSWRMSDGKAVKREQFLVALQRIEVVYVLALLNSNFRSFRSFRSLR